MNSKWMLIIALSFIVLLGGGSVNADVLITKTKIIKHAKSGGERGFDEIELQAPNRCAVFSKAKIKYIKRHYGKVKITKRPNPSCHIKNKKCKLKVFWEHSPAGRVDYKVKVTWDINPCQHDRKK